MSLSGRSNINEDLRTELRDHFYEETIGNTVYNFFIFGLPPGGFTSKLLSKHYNPGESAHPMIKDYVPEMISGVDRLHDFWTGKNFSLWKGWVNLSEQEKIDIMKKFNYFKDSLEKDMIKSIEDFSV